jgi:hypothetical protein
MTKREEKGIPTKKTVSFQGPILGGKNLAGGSRR